MKALLVFFAICGMGFLTGWASGFQWGTADAGFACGITLIVASFIGSMTKLGDFI